eukprot:Sspe_Gene.16559::Locus_5838_Transcript_1_1_Confidence_1.000_Length_5002::g.16559::m.16559
MWVLCTMKCPRDRWEKRSGRFASCLDAPDHLNTGGSAVHVFLEEVPPARHVFARWDGTEVLQPPCRCLARAAILAEARCPLLCLNSHAWGTPRPRDVRLGLAVFPPVPELAPVAVPPREALGALAHALPVRVHIGSVGMVVAGVSGVALDAVREAVVAHIARGAVVPSIPLFASAHTGSVVLVRRHGLRGPVAHALAAFDTLRVADVPCHALVTPLAREALLAAALARVTSIIRKDRGCIAVAVVFRGALLARWVVDIAVTAPFAVLPFVRRLTLAHTLTPVLIRQECLGMAVASLRILALDTVRRSIFGKGPLGGAPLVDLLALGVVHRAREGNCRCVLRPPDPPELARKLGVVPWGDLLHRPIHAARHTAPACLRLINTVRRATHFACRRTLKTVGREALTRVRAVQLVLTVAVLRNARPTLRDGGLVVEDAVCARLDALVHVVLGDVAEHLPGGLPPQAGI